MNVWMRRTTGVVMISAGILAAGATAASANPGDDIDYNQAWQNTTYNQNASSTATSSSDFDNVNYQKGYIPINVTAGNVSASEAKATTYQSGPKFYKSNFGNAGKFSW